MKKRIILTLTFQPKLCLKVLNKMCKMIYTADIYHKQ